MLVFGGKFNCIFAMFQVIRRGDRRPFYAPAKYVVELRPEELEAMAGRATSTNPRRISTMR